MKRPIAALAIAMALAACSKPEPQGSLADGCAGARPLSDLPSPLDVQLAAYVARPEVQLGRSIRANHYSGDPQAAPIIPMDSRSVPNLRGRELVYLFPDCGDMKPGDIWMGSSLAVTVDRATGDIQTVGVGP